MGKKAAPLMHSRNEATLRNVRAAATRDKHLRARLDALEARVNVLEGRRVPAPADAQNDAVRLKNEGADYAGD